MGDLPQNPFNTPTGQNKRPTPTTHADKDGGIRPPSLFSMLASVLIVSVIFSGVEGLSFMEECGWIFTCLYLCDTVERLYHHDLARAQVNAILMLIFGIATFVIFHVF